MTMSLTDVAEWVSGYFRKHSQLRGFAGLRVLPKMGSASGHGEARQAGNDIWLFPKFWKLTPKVQDWVFTHEIGHYMLSKFGLAKLLKLAESLGVDPWDSSTLPYGQMNSDEAFAECFAAYQLNPHELKSRYPQWFELVKIVATQIKTAKARYKKKKTVKTQEGEDMTVYEYSDRQIADRNRKKAERIEKLRKSVDKLRTQVTKDLKSSDEKVRASALAVGLMDHTFERVGNEGSAKEGHYGVTTWTVDHIKFNGNKATVTYVGKSGVDQKKEVTDAKLVSALKAACKDKGKDACLIEATAADVNEYLEPFDISAKDIRGFHANTEMKKNLKAVRSGKLPEDKKKREKKLKDEFTKALELTADAVGHESSTLRSQYLVPGLEDQYLKDGTVQESHTKKAGKILKDTGEKTFDDGHWYLGDVRKDSFIHFTPASYAKEIVESGKLLANPPHPKFGIAGVQAISLGYGKVVPGVQSTHIKTKEPIVAVWFKTNAVPKVGYGEEVIWPRDVPLINPKILSADKAWALLRKAPERLKSEQDIVKYAGRKEKSLLEREDEQVQKMLRPEPKLKPPRRDLRNNRTLQDRDKDLEGLDKQDGGDEDLQKDIRRMAKRVAFCWLAFPQRPSAIRVALWKLSGHPMSGKVQRTNEGAWVAWNQDGVPHGFQEKDKADAYAQGKTDLYTKKDKGKKKTPPKKETISKEPQDEQAPDDESDVPSEDPTEEEVAEGESEDEPEETKAEQDALADAQKDVTEQQAVVDDLMQRLKTVTEADREALEDQIIDEKANLKDAKDTLVAVEKQIEVAAQQEQANKRKQDKVDRAEAKEQAQKQEEATTSKEVKRLQKILDSGKDETGELNEFERKKYERELGEVRTKELASEMAAAEGDDAKAEDFLDQAKKQIQQEQGESEKERRRQGVAETRKITEELIGPGSTLPDNVQKSLTEALGNMSDADAATFAKEFKQALSASVKIPGTSKDGIARANGALSISFEDITDPKELAQAVADAAYAKNVVANPKILGGVPVSEESKSPEQLSARAMEAVNHFRQLSPELREGAAQGLADELGELDPKSNRAKELGHILTGIATAEIVQTKEGDEIKTTPGRPQPSAQGVKLLRAMDQTGNLDQMFKPVEDLTSPGGRAALGEAMRQMGNEDLIQQITGGNSQHPLNPLAEMLEDPELAEDIKAVIREAMIGMETDSMTWGDRAIRDMTGEQDPYKRQAMLVEAQGSKENREFLSTVIAAAKAGDTEFFTESGEEDEETTSLLDTWRAAAAGNVLSQHEDAAEEHKTSPSVAVLRESANSKNPAIMDSEVDPHPETYRAGSQDKKSASKSHFSAYRGPRISEGLFHVRVQSTAPPDRSNSMSKLTIKGAKQVTADLDRLANLFQTQHTTLGIAPNIAQDMALRCDMLSDHIESFAGISRSAQMDPASNYTEEEVAPNAFDPAEIGEESSQAFLRNEDEPYMDAFKQDEFDQLREVQQDGMFSNAKAAAELVKKLAARLEKLDPNFSAQKKSEVTASENDLAQTLDSLGNLQAKLASFYEAVGIGELQATLRSASDKIEKALSEATKAPKAAGEIPEAFKENIQKMKDKAKDKDEDDKDKSDSDDKKDEDKKASYNLFA